MIIAIIMVISLMGSVNAEVTEEWAKSYDGGYDDKANGIAIDSNKNVYVGGEKGHSSSSSYYLIKYD